ncbi:hypothetical protein [Aeromicrobium sp. 179-A 4D2 NHS]|uniref:hypothetical protein n=1 Tax=Aeromicrobium sp. 179-A 4D2 NHS TaxID=3142375 RepID=UPI00399FEE12
MNRRLSQVALSAAAALTLSLAAPVAAQASDTTVTAKRGPVATAVSTQAAPAAASGSVRFTRSAVIGSSTSVYTSTRASVSVPGAVSWYVYADVFVNGAARVRNDLVASNNYPTGSASWPRSSGYGKVQLRNVRVESYDANYNRTTSRLPDSNAVPVRRGTTYKIASTIQKRGKKVTIRAKNWKVYNPNGSTSAVRKLTVKRYYKGKWRGVKHIKLNRNGSGKVTFKQKKKFKYRVYLATTSTIQGTYMYFPRKV